MANIPGTSNRDTIYGTNLDDILNRDGDPFSYPGTAGNDSVYGLGGNDRLYGGLDDDALFGGEGHDELFGGVGTDYLVGDNGNDRLDGGTGADRMYGGAGHDTYVVDDVNDRAFEYSNDGGVDSVVTSVSHTLGFGIEILSLTGSAAIGGTGNELANDMFGNEANNVLSGLNGNDQLQGYDGNDSLYGGEGTDSLYGGAGTDYLVGESGNDDLFGGTGADRMFGGGGDDSYEVDDVGDVIFEDPNVLVGGVDRVGTSMTHTLAIGIERLLLTGSAAVNGTGNEHANQLYGNGANNVLSGLNGDDLINGFDGNDQLFGGNGNDNLLGGDGNDVLNGESGNDVVTGGSGNDVVNGGSGNDILYGYFGNDTLIGGTGKDQLNGEAGNDRFDFNAVSESVVGTNRDVITGFAGAGTALGDQIDLRDIDANTLVSGNQAFTWNGATPGGAGTLWYTGGVLYGNVDGDAAAEFEIQLVGIRGLSVGGAGTDILL